MASLLQRAFRPATQTRGTVVGIGPSQHGTAVQSIEQGRFEQYAHLGMMANGVVFACIDERRRVFSDVEFQWQTLRERNLFGNPSLTLLEKPWFGGTTQDLLDMMMIDNDLGGNAYVYRAMHPDGREVLQVLRPDWVDIVMNRQRTEIVGYLYWQDGRHTGREPAVLAAGEVAHFFTHPDPVNRLRGISWLTPVLREIEADKQTVGHTQKFYQNAATPNLLVKIEKKIESDEARSRLRAQFEQRFGGWENAYKTLILDDGADAVPLGSSFEQAQFTDVQASLENRIVTASGVPSILIGISKGLDASTYCLPFDELVWTDGGPVPIGEIKPGDRVWAPSDGGLRLRRVTWQGAVGEKQVYELRTKNRTLRATGNHPVMVRVPGNSAGPNSERSCSYEWRNVEDLQRGDAVVQVKALPDQTDGMYPPVEADLMRWLGAYVGDGSGSGGRTVCMAFPPDDRVRNHYEKLTEALFGIEPKPDQRSFLVHSAELCRWLTDFGFGGVATTKAIPEWVFMLPRPLRLQFLAGIVDSDGHVDKRGVLQIGFANKRLTEQVKALLVSCGIQVSNLYHAVLGPDVLPQPGTKTEYHRWDITASSAVQVAEIPFADEWYRSRVEDNPKRFKADGFDAAKAGLDDSLLGFYTISSIEPVGIETVYDITVEGDHAFIASGIVVHNSNYGMASRAFAAKMRPKWKRVAGALEILIDRPPEGARLWYDDSDNSAMREDAKDAADVRSKDAQTIRTYVDAGYTPESAVAAVEGNDITLLEHTNLFSVQLQPPGTNEGAEQ